MNHHLKIAVFQKFLYKWKKYVTVLGLVKEEQYWYNSGSHLKSCKDSNSLFTYRKSQPPSALEKV